MAIVASHIFLACGLVLAEGAAPTPSSQPPSSSTGAPAHAAEEAAAEPAAGARVAAQSALAQGNQRLKDGDAAGAVSHYRRAQALYPPAAAKIEFNIAKAEQQRGDQPAAAAAFERFLSQSAEIPPEFREEASNELHRLTAQLGALKVVEKRPGLLVSIDGQVQGRTPLPGNIWVRPGRRTVTVNDGDKERFRETVSIAAGATVEVDVDVILRASPPPSNALAKPMVVSPIAAVSPLKATPTNQEAAAGVPAFYAQDSSPAATSQTSPLWKRWWFWAAAGAVAAGTITIFLVANRCPANTNCMAAILKPP